MALNGTHLTQGGDTNAALASIIVTASVSPTADALIVITIGESVNQTRPTVTGNGITYTFVGGIETGLRRHHVFRGLAASPTTGVITLDYGAGQPNALAWTVDEITGVNTGGTNGSAAIRQVTTNSGSGVTGSVTLAAFDNAANGTFGAFHSDVLTTSTPGTGFTELSDVNVDDPPHTLAVNWRNDNDTVVDNTWALTGAWRALAFEIVAAGTTVTATTVASMVWTGVAGTVSRSVAASPGSIVWTGVAGNVSRSVTATAVGSIVWTGVAGSITRTVTAATVGSIVYNGVAGTVTTGTTVTATTVGSIVWTGIAGTVSRTVTAAGVAGVVYTGTAGAVARVMTGTGIAGYVWTGVAGTISTATMTGPLCGSVSIRPMLAGAAVGAAQLGGTASSGAQLTATASVAVCG